MRTYQWVSIFFSATVFFAIQALYWRWRNKRARQDYHLKQRVLGHHDSIDDQIRIRGEGQARKAVFAPGFGKLRQTLIEAGYGLAIGKTIRQFSLTVITAVGLTTILSGDVKSGLWAGIFTVIGLSAWISRRRNQRLNQLTDQMPHAMQVIVLSLRAGISLEESIRQASEEVDDPLAREFARCYEEYSLGRPIEDVLAQSRLRWPTIASLSAFAEAVIVLKRTGGNLIEVLEQLVEFQRLQSSYIVKHRAITAEGKMSGKILMALPIGALFIQLVSDRTKLYAFFADETGRMLLFWALIFWTAGVLWISRLLRPLN